MPTDTDYINAGDLALVGAKFDSLRPASEGVASQYMSLPDVAQMMQFTVADVRTWIEFGQPGRDGGHVLLFTVEVLPGCYLVPYSALLAYGTGQPYAGEQLLLGPAPPPTYHNPDWKPEGYDDEEAPAAVMYITSTTRE